LPPVHLLLRQKRNAASLVHPFDSLDFEVGRYAHPMYKKWNKGVLRM